MPYSLRNTSDAGTPAPPISQGTLDDDTQDDTKPSALVPTATQEDTETAQSLRDEQSSTEDSDTDYQFWNGESPPVNGTLATIFTDKETQAKAAVHEKLVDFLLTKKNENKANKLQFNNDLIPFITAVPNTNRKVRLVYGVGSSIGLTGIHDNALEEKILALTGEYEAGIAFPSVLQFPATALTPIELNIPSFQEFNIELEKGTKSAKWFKYADLTRKAELPMLVPVPAIYVSDGFDGDIDAADLYERLTAIHNSKETKIDKSLHLVRSFLTAVVVNYNKKDPTILAPLQTFMSQASPLINKWKKQRMEALFPILTQPASSQIPPNVPTPVVPTTIQAPTNEWSPTDFLKAFAALNTNSNKSNTEDDRDQATKDTLGMGSFAYHLLLDLCGLAPSNADEMLPLWKQLAEKNLSKSDKTTFVRRALEDRIKWSEAKVLPLNTILTMVVTRAWEGETTLSSLTSAAKGLTPFAVPCLSESEVTAQNDQADALEAASSTTVKDHSTLKLIASAPTSFDGLVKRIKRFGNLLFAVFGDTSALFMQIEDMIIALDSYGEYARTTMSHQTIASILWILHLQARHYSAGAMKGSKALKAEFTMMMNAITTKAPVLHMDTPPKLYTPTTTGNSVKRPPSPQPATPHQPADKKHKPNNNADKYKLVDRNIMNAKMKIAMKPILSLPKVPNMGRICRAARVNAGDLFPNHKDICIRSQVLGTCFSSCTHKHIKLEDRDVENAIKILESVNANTALVKVN
jgi:hypothetical protein